MMGELLSAPAKIDGDFCPVKQWLEFHCNSIIHFYTRDNEMLHNSIKHKRNVPLIMILLDIFTLFCHHSEYNC